MTEIKIRTAQLKDIETLFQIRTSVNENYQSRQELAEMGVTEEAIAQMLQTNSCAWIAEINQQPIGFSFANATEKTVFGMFVLPGYEGQGAGRALMETAENWLWSQGAEEIWLLTDNNSNFRAYGFYQHLGWRPTEVQPREQMKFVKSKSRS